MDSGTPPRRPDLAGLGRADLIALRDEVDTLLAATDAGAREWPELLTAALDSAAYNAVGARPFRSPASRVRARRAARRVERWLDRAFASESRQRAALAAAVAEVYVESLASRGVPLAAGPMIRNLDRLPAEVDKAFPGYAASGLLAAALLHDPNPKAHRCSRRS